MQLILASASKGRKKLLTQLGIKFKIVPSDIDEEKITESNYKLLVQKIARAKALAVLKKIKNQQFNHKAKELFNHLIIAADSMVVLGKKTIGKPKDKPEAVKNLSLLSGKTHKFITGLCIIPLPQSTSGVEDGVKSTYTETKVTFRKLTEKDIKNYFQLINPTLFAGGYSILPPQDFITKIEGSLSNVIGLPLEKILPVLRRHNLLP